MWGRPNFHQPSLLSPHNGNGKIRTGEGSYTSHSQQLIIKFQKPLTYDTYNINMQTQSAFSLLRKVQSSGTLKTEVVARRENEELEEYYSLLYDIWWSFFNCRLVLLGRSVTKGLQEGRIEMRSDLLETLVFRTSSSSPRATLRTSRTTSNHRIDKAIVIRGYRNP